MLAQVKNYTYSPITKLQFNKWHSEGSLLLLGAGNGYLEDMLKRLDDIEHDYKADGKQVTVATIDGKQNRVIMFSNGCEEFIIVIDDMTSSDYASEYHKRTGKQHLTVYVVND